MRMVIAGGGTGGHVTLALATLATLRTRLAGTPLDLLWIGTAGGVERRIADEHGIPFRSIQAGKLRRYLSLENVIDFGRIPIGAGQALVALRRFRPDVVFSTGGFVSVPTVAAAGLLRLPVLIHEQTAQFGLANRLNLRFATTIALPYEASRAFVPRTTRRVVVTGNPVRAEIRHGDRAEGARLLGFNPDLPTIYATGGARGARAINAMIAAILPDLVNRYQIIHSCGTQDVPPTLNDLSAIGARLPEALRSRYVVRDFVGAELPHVYALSALVIGRSGAGTVAELAALGKPALLIPLPGTGGDEQTKNARLLADVGGAIMLAESELTPTSLLATIDQLLDPEARDRLEQLGRAARTQAPPDAAGALAEELLRLWRTGRNG
ncbi:MAG: UDP-N-acetylglucosamine--N-acetylmuramyl-(pentapeptide) pyrophosphoryl-undecaprenol N-acetylglucosamine transferase [uncultured Thermomicrobiales bacterium]|uniref:UDP-N-acetylglucosamine--N-acetylmuramyl-(pentapeptide) pyrophosphoryl-undecaprenol N-acetylglucosamine transferase n=1 Tax=uncultured Thermomicrobiales bacterium TaxID=1645740 RepID=A0A6J4VVJ3_9BACT|nr:MAG: UDP-N-acetylglucosamine--N-acetylmuramyl-(pentapeptide) pyrophosphoryl-undecaprenol N-acetylglucosamine transferase [uncultured Thermomicrobiales bacterium]